ncbi:hypothetical protein [Massilia sp.]|uniref:hypothetical protein n=1 Tax=Massilia sp. TaxID=1882437 RepID=UPI0028B14BF4|nr:hypothetical protein [Massilia sp.]
MMFDLFKRMARAPAFDAAGLGVEAIARPIASGCALPASSVGVAVDRAGHTRRISAGGRINLLEGESGWCFHPGPYGCDLLPFAAAPEIGLRLHFAIDSPDPRVSQQRFDLFLASEGAGELLLADFSARVEDALQRELAQGNLDLPPCTTLDEWNAFRAGLNQLLYTRFGVTVDDCVPVDLRASRDFAQELRTRAIHGADEPFLGTAPATPPVLQPSGQKQPFDPAVADARALRRLFLELPCLMCRVRQAALPSGQALFRQQQSLLQRLDLVCLAASTMPSLALAAPGQPLAMDQQLRRARNSVEAAAALDEAWALLARFELAEDQGLEALFDEADRIVANLEQASHERKLVAPQEAA